MKKPFLIGGFVCLLTLCFGVCAHANMLGDVNADGVVNAADARLTLRAAVGLEQFSDLQIRAADADHNKQLSAADARLILRNAVGLESFVHYFGQEDGSIETLVVADCGNDGKIRLTCSCGMYQDQIVPATGKHQFSSDAVLEKPATCTEDGTAFYQCSVCAKRAYFTTPATGHSLETQTIAATCTEDGRIVRRCTVCDYSEQDLLPALGHTFAENYTVDNPPTCIAAGSQSRHCVYCSARTDVVVLPMVAHQFGPWRPCADGQTKTRTCLNCDETQTERIVPDPEPTTEAGPSTEEETTHMHDFILTESVAPSCENPGRVSYRCAGCGFSYYEPTDALGHNDELEHTTPPSCTADGSSIYRCSRCGRTRSETVAAAGHKPEFSYSADRKIRYTVCSVCGEAIASESMTGYCVSNDGTKTPYFDFEDALQSAAAGTRVVLAADYTLNRSVNIPAGVTLWIKCNGDELRSNGSTSISVFEYAVDPNKTPYCRLRVPQDITLSVYGTLIIDAEISPKTEDDETSFDVFGGYGEIVLDGKIIVCDGGSLYCHGFVNTSESPGGLLMVEKGGKLFETFAVKDWHGMTAAYNLALAGNWPITDSAMDKLRTTVELHCGASFYGCGKLFYTDSSGSLVSSDFLLPVLDGENGLICLSSGASMQKTVSLDASAAAKTVYSFFGGAVFSGVMLDLTPETKLTTSEYAFPIGKNTAVILHGGAYTLKASVLLQSPLSILRSEDASLTPENGAVIMYLS